MLIATHIRTQSQTLVVSLPIVGTSVALHYASHRCPGRRAASDLRVPLTGPEPPDGLVRILTETTVDGRTVEKTFQPRPDLSYEPEVVASPSAEAGGYAGSLHPDERPGTGSTAPAQRAVTMRIGYVIRSSFLRAQRTEWVERRYVLGVWDGRNARLGGWTLGVEHHLDPELRLLHRGDGRRRSDVEVLGPSDRGPGRLLEEGELGVLGSSGQALQVFDAQGRQLRTVDDLSGRLIRRFHRGEGGELAEVEPAGGRTVRFDRGDRTLTVAGPGPYVTRLTLGEDGRLVAARAPGEEVGRFEYGRSGLLAHLAAPDGLEVTYGYGEDGRLRRIETSEGFRESLARTELEAGHRVVRVTGEGREQSYQIERLVDGGLRRTKRCCGLPGTQVTELRGDRRTIRMPDGTVAVRDVDRGDGESRVRHELRTPGGLEHVFERRLERREHGGWAVEETVAGRATSLRFDPTDGSLVTVTPAGRRVRAELDGEYRLVSWEGYGRRLAGRATYDEEGRPIEIREGERRVRASYDEEGRLITLSEGDRRTAFRYDAAGRLVRQVLPDGGELRFAYDGGDRITAITPPGRPPTRFSYGPDGRLLRQEFPATGAGKAVRAWDYDADGRVTGLRRADGRVLRYPYDEGGRPVGVRVEGGDRELGYDVETGRLVSLSTGEGEVVRVGWDGFLPVRFETEGTAPGVIGITYDDGLRVREVTVEGAGEATSVPFEYDDDGLDVRAGDLAIERHPETGRVVRTRLGTVTERRSHDADGRIIRYTAAAADRELLSFEYDYDERSRIVGISEGLEGTSKRIEYDFDEADRLCRVSVDGQVVEALTYDTNGNPIRRTTPDGVIEAAYDEQDRLLRRGAVRFLHSADGERVERTDDEGTTCYRYDPHGNLVQVRLPDGRTVGYVIDALGRRIARSVDGEPTHRWLFDGLRTPVAELGPDGEVHTLVVRRRGAHFPSYLVRDGRRLRILSDHLGSPRLVVDAESGDTLQRLSYDPWGRVVGDSAPGFQPFGFTGGQLDVDTGLVHLGAREYDPRTTRFTRRDPLLFHGGMTNLYGYARHDPVNHVDPTGAEVYVCSGRFLGPLDHQWIKTDTYEAGQDFVGNRRGYDTSWDEYATLDTSWVDHSGRNYENEQCEPVEDVDEECVNSLIRPGTPIGTYGVAGICWTQVDEVINRCSTNRLRENYGDWQAVQRGVRDLPLELYREAVDTSERFWDWVFE